MLFGGFNFWDIIILGVPVIVVFALAFGLAFVIRKGLKGSGAIERVLKDIE